MEGNPNHCVGHEFDKLIVLAKHTLEIQEKSSFSLQLKTRCIQQGMDLSGLHSKIWNVSRASFEASPQGFGFWHMSMTESDENVRWRYI
jgi:hypothetical protein